MPSNFVCAGAESILFSMEKALAESEGRITTQGIVNLLKNTVNKFLTSFGTIFSKNEKPDKRFQRSKFEKLAKTLVELKSINGTDLNNVIEIYLDSGGFSIQQGYFVADEMETLIDYYHDFLRNYGNLFDYAFTLDFAPGLSVFPYKSLEHMNDLVWDSYRKTAELDDNLRQKVFFIYHSRTKTLEDIYSPVFDELSGRYFHFSVGGLVSQSRVSTKFYSYAIPLEKFVKSAKKSGLKSFRFHVLGATEWKEILGHKVLEELVRRLTDIDMTITYDSTSLIRIFQKGRYTYVLDDDGVIRTISLRYDDLNKHLMSVKSNVYSDLTNLERFVLEYNKVVSGLEGVEELDTKTFKLYKGGPESGLTNFGSFVATVQLFGLFPKIEKLCESYAKVICDEFESGGSDLFKVDLVNYLDEIMLNFSNSRGKVVKERRSVDLLDIINILTEDLTGVGKDDK